MVKLQKHKAYTYKADNGEEIEHYKHLVTIPEEMVRELGWKNGIELQPVIKRDTLVLQPKDEEESEIS